MALLEDLLVYIGVSLIVAVVLGLIYLCIRQPCSSDLPQNPVDNYNHLRYNNPFRRQELSQGGGPSVVDLNVNSSSFHNHRLVHHQLTQIDASRPHLVTHYNINMLDQPPSYEMLELEPVDKSSEQFKLYESPPSYFTIQNKISTISDR